MLQSEIDHISLEVITCHNGERGEGREGEREGEREIERERARARERAREIERETHRQNSSTHTDAKAYAGEYVCINVRHTHADRLYRDGQDAS